MIELPIVIDSSLTMAWCFKDEATGASDAIRDRLERTSAVVPAHWPIEVQNSARVGERRGKVSLGELGAFIAFVRLQHIELDVRPLDATFGDLLALSRQYGVTPYDAAYIELALRRGLPLATRDANMARAAQSLGITLLDTA